MELNAETISLRLSTIENTQPSIVAHASWCTINAFSADAILSEWATQITSPNQLPAKRLALLNLVHEIVATCAYRASGSESAQVAAQELMFAIAKLAPAALKSAVAVARDDLFDETKAALHIGLTPFWTHLQNILIMWRNSELFPTPWIQGLIKATALPNEINEKQDNSYQDVASTDNTVPRELQMIVKLYAKFQHAKSRYEREKHPAGADATDVTRARQEALQRLNALISALDAPVEEDEDGNRTEGGLLTNLKAELLELEGFSQEAEETADPMAEFFE